MVVLTMYRLVLAIFLSASIETRAQPVYSGCGNYENSWGFEAGVSAGFMNAITDLGGGKTNQCPQTINWKNSKPAAGAFFAAIFKNTVTLRLECCFGNVSAHDSMLEPIKSAARGRYERNLGFKTHINEIQLIGEIYPGLFFHAESETLFHPYAAIGAGLYSFNPKSKLDGTWYALQPLRTEGQGFAEYPGRKPYKLTQLNLALGAGIKYDPGSLLRIRAEFNWRFLQTDYLDDVSTTYIDPALFNGYLPDKQVPIAKKLQDRRLNSNPAGPAGEGQRGNPAKKDSYFTFQVKASILLGQKPR